MGNFYQPEPKMYRALLTQTSTNAPVITELYNTLGGVPTAAYSSTGVYTLTLTGLFPETKTQVWIENWGGTPPIGIYDYKTSGNDNSITIKTFSDIRTAVAANDILSNTSILITVDP